MITRNNDGSPRKKRRSNDVSRTGTYTAPTSLATKEDWIWLAGFFEGEGHVDRSSTSQGQRPSLTIAQVNPEPMVKVQAICGGSTFVRKGGNGIKDCLIWKCFGDRAERVAANIYPYLSTKRKREIQPLLEGI